MKSSPIYNIIDNPRRKSDCSFGAGNRFTQQIQVGTSAGNSHTLASISVERHERSDGKTQFTLWIDNTLVKSGLLEGREFRFITDEIDILNN